MFNIDNKNFVLSLLLNNTEKEIIVDGNKKIMFSCPHCVKHYRNGIEKLDEPDTLIIANYINNKFDLPYIYKVNSINEDANYDKISNYKSLLSQYIRKNNIKVLFDLHQLNPLRDIMVNIGINNSKNINNIKYCSELISIFSNNNIGKISIDSPFAASGDNTISTYIHNNNNIDCLQIELNSKLFQSNELYNKVLDCFYQIINNIAV